ncbi:MAG: hypothetical protein N4S00_00635 [Lactobacillus crispatus]|nr:hypothetical protein [Lactobacillus crispatus]
MPWLIFKHSLDKTRVNVVNANHYQISSLEEIGVYITPAFRIDNQSYNTIDVSKIERLWNSSK